MAGVDQVTEDSSLTQSKPTPGINTNVGLNDIDSADPSSPPGARIHDNAAWRGGARDVMGVVDGIVPVDENEARTFGDDNEDDPACAGQCWAKCCKIAQVAFPPLQWVPNYSLLDLKGDMISGITVGCMLVPQSMAYATLADLPPQNGLYSSCIGLIVYSLLGTSRQLGLGPVAVVSLMVASAIDPDDSDELKVAAASQLAFLVGIVLFVLGLLRAGVLVNFISHSVMSAFTSAAGITIGASQFKYLFGITVPRYDYAMVFQTIIKILSELDEANGYAVIMGFSSILALMLLRMWKSRHSAPPTEGCKVGWYILMGIADFSALVLALTTTIWAWLWNMADINVDTVGDIPSGYASPNGDGVPSFSETSSIMIVCMVIALVGYLESMSVAQIMASKFQYTVNANQELIAIGAANFIASFFSAFPCVGSFSRTAVHGNVGAKTQLAGAISSLIVLGALYFLTKLFVYLPYCALAAMIEVAVLNLIDINAFIEAWKLHKRDFIVMITTFVVTLCMSVKIGLFTGICLSILLVVQHSAFPRCSIHGKRPNGAYRDVGRFPDAVEIPSVLIVVLHAKIFFANANRFGSFVSKAIRRANEKQDVMPTGSGKTDQAHGSKGDLNWLVLDARAITDVDLSGLHVLHEMCNTLRKKHQIEIVICNVSDKVKKQLNGAAEVLGDVAKEVPRPR